MAVNEETLVTADGKPDATAIAEYVRSKAPPGPAAQTNGEPAKAATPTPEQSRPAQAAPAEGAPVPAADKPAATDGAKPVEPATDKWWETPGMKELVDSFAISPEDAASFSSADEFTRAVRFFDRQRLRAMDSAPAEPPPAAPEPEAKPKAEQKPTLERDEKGRFKVNLDPERYSKEVVEDMQKLADMVVSRVEQAEQAFKQQMQEREIVESQSALNAAFQAFDAHIDALGMPEIFGTTGKLNREEFERRKKAFHTTARLTGADLSQINLVNVSRAANCDFHKEIADRNRRLLSQQIRDASAMRSGVSRTPVGLAEPYKGDPRTNPNILAAIRKAEGHL